MVVWTMVVVVIAVIVVIVVMVVMVLVTIITVQNIHMPRRIMDNIRMQDKRWLAGNHLVATIAFFKWIKINVMWLHRIPS